MFKEFIKEQEEAKEVTTEVIFVLPGLIFGEPIIASNFSSIQTVSAILQGFMPAIADVSFPVCDVREVADAHYQALVRDGLHGHRFGICTEVYSFAQVS